MPSGPASMKEMAALGLDYAFMHGAAKYLRPAGLLTTHVKGGGASAHWSALDYARIIVSLAGDQASDAPAAQAAFWFLPHRSTVTQNTTPAGFTSADVQKGEGFAFGDYLLDEIQHAASLSADDRQREREDTGRATITFSQFPQRVEVTFWIGSETRRLIFAAQAPCQPGDNALLDRGHLKPTPLWRQRTTTLPYAAVLVAADLLAQVPASVGNITPEGSASAGHATLGDTTNENAPDLARSGARDRNDQPHANATGGYCNTSERREGGTLSQSLSSLSRGWANPQEPPHHVAFHPAA